jgi:hypothetical protein
MPSGHYLTEFHKQMLVFYFRRDYTAEGAWNAVFKCVPDYERPTLEHIRRLWGEFPTMTEIALDEYHIDHASIATRGKRKRFFKNADAADTNDDYVSIGPGDEFVFVRPHRHINARPLKKSLRMLQEGHAEVDIKLVSEPKSANFSVDTWFFLKDVTFVHATKHGNSNSFLLDNLDENGNKCGNLVRIPFKYFISMEADVDVDSAEQEEECDADVVI